MRCLALFQAPRLRYATVLCAVFVTFVGVAQAPPGEAHRPSLRTRAKTHAAVRTDSARRTLGVRPAPGDTAIAITLLETTDLHGALLDGSKDRVTGRTWGGAAVVAAWQRKLAARTPGRTFLFDGGDMMQGSPISNLVRGRSVIDVMNAEGYDAAACGNHEFDWSIDTLRARIRQARFPVLACNIFEKRTGVRPQWIQPYTMVRRGGVTVGVIGAATPETPLVTVPSNVASLRFDDPVPLVNALVPELRDRGADVIVLLMHIGGEAPNDSLVTGPMMDVARAVEGADVIFGGHTHQFISTSVNGQPVVEAASHGRCVGEVDLVVNRVNHLVRVVGQELHRTYTDSVAVPAGDSVSAIVARYNKDVAPIMNRVLGTLADSITRRSPAMGNFVADAMRRAAHTDIAFTNAGGLRRDLDAGPVTLGMVYELLPFENSLVTMRMTGAQVKQVLEEQPSRVNFSGLRAHYDATRPAGDRVVDLEQDGGANIDSHAVYTVVTNDFMAQGGDGFITFTKIPDHVNTGRLIRDVVVEWIESETRRGRSIEAETDDRFPGRPGRNVH
jgi:2',3'-cyclic-nucleotide 2'-phosphodiesterase/3'-nucleotidase